VEGPNPVILSSPETIRRYHAAGWWGDETLLDLWNRNLAAHPERTALVDPPNRPDLTAGEARRWTYAETDLRASRLAAALRAAGVHRDDVVMVQLPNVVELPLVYLAALKVGAIVSPLPVQYRGHELRHTMAVVEPRAFITAAPINGHDHVLMALEHAGDVPGPMALIGLADDEGALPAGVLGLTSILEAEASAGAVEELAARASAHRSNADEIVTVCWTSGTEAEPKGVPRSHNMWISIAYATTDGARLADGAVMLNPFPMVNMSGIGGMFVPWLQVAGTLVMHHPLSLPVFLGQIGAERSEYTVAPPILLNLLLANEALLAQADLSSMRVIGSGSAPLSTFMVESWKRRFGIEVLNFFGSNEGTALIGDPTTVPDPAERARYFPRFGANGPAGDEWGNRAARGMETRLVDPMTGRPVTEPDQPGELHFRGPTLFPGYYRRPEMTERAFDRDGFYRTGDLFEITGSAAIPSPRSRAPAAPGRNPASTGDRLRYVGRARDLIIRGGMKVAPEELEALIATHPAVGDVAVLGVEDRRIEGEQRICVAVVPKPTPPAEAASASPGSGTPAAPASPMTLGALRAFLAEKQVAAYKMPKQLLVLDALPRNPLGKVLKRDLRMRFEGRGGSPSVAEEAEASR
jgi:acyl-CoA synthetase